MTIAFPEATLVKGATQSDVTTSGNVDTNQAVAMSISAEGTAHIMSLLTDLYSDPNLAVLREYSSNAKDSHVEAGTTRPVEVTLPSRLDPVFHVEDFGIGMSSDTIRTIYSSYGASTKRKDFTQVGAFGLGCKSALTMTQQFTLVSIKDGIKSTVLISRGDDGVGQVNVVSEVKTDKPNGVRVSVPIQDVNVFNANVEGFFKWWAPGTVLVNGAAPQSVFDNHYYKCADGKTYLRSVLSSGSRYDAGFHVLMGDIAYDVNLESLGIDQYRWGSPSNPRQAVSRLMNSYIHTVIEIPIGSVDLTPSREDLRYSPRTSGYLLSLVDYIADSIGPFISSLFEDVATRTEAFTRYLEWANFVTDDNVTYLTKSTGVNIQWNGEDIETEFTVDNGDIVSYRLTSSNGGVRAHRALEGHVIPRIRIAGHNAKTKFAYIIRPAQSDDKLHEKQLKDMRRDLPLWAEHNGVGRYEYADYFLIDELPDSKWFTDNEFFVELKFEDIAQDAKTFRSEERKNRVKGTPSKVEYFYKTFRYATDLKARPDGSKELIIEDTSHLSLPTSGYYLEAPDVKNIHGFGLHYSSWDSYSSKHSTALESMFTMAGLSDTDTVILVGRSMTLKALENRTNGTYVHFPTAVKKKAREKLKSMPKEEILITELLDKGAYSSSRAVFYADGLIDFREKFKDNTVLYDFLGHMDQALTNKPVYAMLKSQLGVEYASNLDFSVGIEMESYARKIKREFDKYPLLPNHYGRMDDISTTVKTHIALYIEATTEKGS